jgi:excisionase family DNA binding protein
MVTVLSCKQAAVKLHLSVPEVKNLALSGRIPAVFYGGKIHFIEAEIEEWREKHTELITDLVGIKTKGATKSTRLYQEGFSDITKPLL